MNDKIEKLLEQIKKDFPVGCDGILCENCPLDNHSDDGTPESAVCEMLSILEYQKQITENP